MDLFCAIGRRRRLARDSVLESGSAMATNDATAGLRPAAGRLTEPQRRKLRIWRAVVRTSLALTWICLAALLALFFLPRAPKILRVVTGAVLVESFLTAAVLGAFGKCPACGEGFGLEGGRLVPERCRSCGAGLAQETGAGRSS